MSTNGFCFENEWPSAASRLKSSLRSRKIPDSLIDDLVQETAIRLFKNWERVDPERGVWPLAVTVAMNVLRDQMRVEARRRDVTLPMFAVQDDPETAALARVELQRVREAMEHLPAAQRTALLAEIGESRNGDKSSAAIKMLRMRARKRLRAMTREASGLLGTLELLIQRLIGRSPLAPFSSGTAVCAPVAACVLTLGMFAPGHVSGGLESLSPPRSTGAATSGALELVLPSVHVEVKGHEHPVEDGLWGDGRSELAAVGVAVGEPERGRASKKKPVRRPAGDGEDNDAGRAPEVPHPYSVLPEEEDSGSRPSADVDEPEVSTGSDNAGAKTGGGASAGGHSASATIEAGPGGVDADVRVDGKEVLAEPDANFSRPR